jgi:hypothetical protein
MNTASRVELAIFPLFSLLSLALFLRNVAGYEKRLVGNALSVPAAEIMLRPLQEVFESREYQGYAYPFAWQESSSQVFLVESPVLLTEKVTAVGSEQEDSEQESMGAFDAAGQEINELSADGALDPGPGSLEEDEDLDRKPAARALQPKIEPPSRKQAPAPTVPKHECNQTKIEADDSAVDSSSEHLEIINSEKDLYESHEEVDRKPAASARQPSKKEPDFLELTPAGAVKATAEVPEK